jgi:4-hydroxymandelate oxidase
MTRILPPLDRIPGNVVALSDYEPLARERMTASAWAYLSGGAGDEIGLRRNREAFERIELRTRVLTDLSAATTRVTLFGRAFDYPILLAPVAYQRLAHPAGEFATAEAAAVMKTGMVLSTQSSVSLEDVAASTSGPLWFQLYIQPDRAFTHALVQRAEQAGYQALVLTVDAPVNGVRNREQRAGFALPEGVEAVNLRGMVHPEHTPRSLTESPLFGTSLIAAAPTWRDVEWLRSITRLPVILKGITSENDAERAVTLGVAGIIVSNHGARTLDTIAPPINLLPRIVRQVARRIPVLVDGGIRRGTDVFKALASGAQAVMIGRPYVYALATAGALGVAHAIAILRAELEVAMALTGCARVEEIDHTMLWSPPSSV